MTAAGTGCHAPDTRAAHTAVAVEESINFVAPSGPADAWDKGCCAALIVELQVLRRSMLEAEARLVATSPDPSASARNLVHYLVLRRHDLRPLQERLAGLGLSSLGRAETHVLANVDKVLGILHALCGRAWSEKSPEEPAGYRSGRALLMRHGEALFGPPPRERGARIMVTLPSEAATDAALVRDLVRSGMDVARINCAHDDADAWVAMASQVREAAHAAGRTVRVMMDLAGPKIRTGPMAPRPSVLKLKALRDPCGKLTVPAALLLRPSGCHRPANGATPAIEVDARWLAQLRAGDRIDFRDARAKARRLHVLEVRVGGVRAEARRTAYVLPGTRLHISRKGVERADADVSGVPLRPGQLQLHRGDTLGLTRAGPGQDAIRSESGRIRSPATVSCTLPQVLRQLRKGERVWFDDGRVGGVIRRVGPRGVDVQITDASVDGDKLLADKGINLPDSRLDLPALTGKDIADLDVVARHADIVALSFAQCADDVHALRERLDALGAQGLGVVLKIETRRGFEQLPEMLFAAMACHAAGVMIARGDLAVECGFERMAEVQEEILWACEAAHMPVVWATQVLESLAKTGRPSRAEITDAAMSERADCVMLNKGPHILLAIHALDDILRRMQEHQSKKRPLLRALKAWTPPRA
jgi:pyruvate kinase